MNLFGFLIMYFFHCLEGSGCQLLNFIDAELSFKMMSALCGPGMKLIFGIAKRQLDAFAFGHQTRFLLFQLFQGFFLFFGCRLFFEGGDSFDECLQGFYEHPIGFVVLDFMQAL